MGPVIFECARFLCLALYGVKGKLFVARTSVATMKSQLKYILPLAISTILYQQNVLYRPICCLIMVRSGGLGSLYRRYVFAAYRPGVSQLHRRRNHAGDSLTTGSRPSYCAPTMATCDPGLLRGYVAVCRVAFLLCGRRSHYFVHISLCGCRTDLSDLHISFSCGNASILVFRSVQSIIRARSFWEAFLRSLSISQL